MQRPEGDPVVNIGVSARHVHLTQDVVDVLFGKGYQLEPREPDTKGQWPSKDRVTVVGPKGKFDRVCIMGPCRNINQFELSLTDTYSIGIPAPLRMSGDIEGTPGFTLVGPAGEVTLDKGAIIAKRHIHMGKIRADRLGLKDGDNVLLITTGKGGRTTGFMDTIMRVGGDFDRPGDCHIDTDEGNACLADSTCFGFIAGKSEDFRGGGKGK